MKGFFDRFEVPLTEVELDAIRRTLAGEVFHEEPPEDAQGKEARMKSSGYHYELERNHAGKWFWRRVSSNGLTQFVAQAYANKSNARRAIRNLDPNATITEVQPKLASMIPVTDEVIDGPDWNDLIDAVKRDG